MIAAWIAVGGCILCSLWFNGSFAWSKGGEIQHQLAMVALALTIDLCKIGFLPAASRLWQARWYFPATLMCLLWFPAITFSTYAGYASISANRATATNTTETQAQQRARAQTQYDDALAAIATAKTSRYWNPSSACTAPRTDRHRSFCENVAAKEAERDAASQILNATFINHADPELAVLVATTGWSMVTLTLVITLLPALLLELVASVGFYAVHRDITPKPRSKLVNAELVQQQELGAKHSETPPQPILGGSRGRTNMLADGKATKTPTPRWNIPPRL